MPRRSSWKKSMNLASETTASLWAPLTPLLDALLARLEDLSLEPGMAAQQQIALVLPSSPILREGRCWPRCRRKRS